MSNYRRRIVAFIDILGFKSLIAQVEAGAILSQEISHLMRTTRNRTRSGSYFSSNISDAIVMSSALDTWGLGGIITSINATAERLLEMGYFIRGAITAGNLFHDQHTVYGQGLVDAYQAEAGKAIYPRIIVADELLGSSFRGSPGTHKAFRIDQDGVAYIHVLSGLEGAGGIAKKLEGDRRSRFLRRYVRMREAIEGRLVEARANGRHFAKVRWFADYWNSCAPNLPELPPIQIGEPSDC